MAYSYGGSILRTGDDEAAFFSVLVRLARFVFCLGPWNDWQAELNQPSGDNSGRRQYADVQFSRNSNIVAVWLLDQVDDNLVYRAVVPCSVDRIWSHLADRPRPNAILRELLPSEVETWTNELVSTWGLNKAY